jgi:hypothetical protein
MLERGDVVGVGESPAEERSVKAPDDRSSSEAGRGKLLRRLLVEQLAARADEAQLDRHHAQGVRGAAEAGGRRPARGPTPG